MFNACPPLAGAGGGLLKSTRQTFSKAERLHSRKLIELVVQKGKSVSVGNYHLKWTATELKSKFPVQIAIAVPKKKFKRAVDRNRIKRLIREVYRKNKTPLYAGLDEQEKQIAALVVYTGETIPLYQEVEKDLNLLLQKLEKAATK